MKAPLAAKNPFGLGAQIFGDAPVPAATNEKENDETPEEESDTESNTSEESLLTAMTNTNLDDSAWAAVPAYPPLYLSTASEYLPPKPKPKLPPGAQVSDPVAEEGGKDISWAFEPYENSLKVDQVFDRFTKRVEYEGEQCIR